MSEEKLPVILWKDYYKSSNYDPFFKDPKDLDDEERAEYLKIMHKEFNSK